jgi:hypothetical protein
MRLETTTRLPDPAQFLTPVPPALEGVLEERGVDELARHRELAARYREASEGVGHARRELEQAGVADAQAEHDFAGDPAGKLPAPKAQKARERLERAEREHDVLGRELVRSASVLVNAAAPYVDEAAGRVAEQVEQDAAEAREALEAALEVLGRRGPVTREAAWLSMAQTKARVPAWRPVGAAPDAAGQAVRQALAVHDEETAKRRERREQRALEEEVFRLHERGMPLGEARAQALARSAT